MKDDLIRSASLLVKTALADAKILERLKTNPESELKNLETSVIAKLPVPDNKTNNKIWLIIVISFALVMISSTIVLEIGIFYDVNKEVTKLTKPDTILTIFTTVVGFLAGLLSPSPISKK